LLFVAPLTLRSSLRRAEGNPSELTRHLASARNARLRLVPGYYQSRLTALGPRERQRFRFTVAFSKGQKETYPAQTSERRIASADSSMSFSLVDQLETETRMAAMPCHVVPLSQQAPSCCTRSMTARVSSSD